MRVVLVSQEMPPQTAWGGIGAYVDVLSQALAKGGAEVHVVSSVPGQRPSSERRGDVTVHRLGQLRVRGPGRLLRAPESTRRAWTALAAVRAVRRIPAPDVIECPEWQAEGLALSARPRAPLVVRLHSSARQVFAYSGQGAGLRGWDGRVAARMEEASARRANLVIGTRSNLEASITALGLDVDAARPIPVPVRLAAPRPPAPAAPPRVVCVGRLEPLKAPDVLVRAAPAILSAVPEARIAFVGRDGVAPGLPGSTAWLRAEGERLGVAHALDFLGQLDADGVVDQIASATVCAFPSRRETFGIAAAEAAGVGRPLVTSTIAPFADLVADGETGVRVATDDIAGWGEAISRLLGDPVRAAAMGARGAEHIRAVCDPDRVASLTLEAYELAIERWRQGLRARR